MTNKELADRLAKTGQGIPVADLVLIEEAARRLRELPDPTPQPLTLRGLVEKHECLSNHLCTPPYPDPRMPWAWDLDGVRMWLTDSAALTVLRGIVKGLCDERNTDNSWAGCWSWRPTEDTHWIFNTGNGGYNQTAATELEAIDALLTAMQVGKG